MSAHHHRYVAPLRAINVGGRSSIRMAELRALLESLGCSGVTTYIQSGNVVFDTSEGDRARLTARIEAALEGTLGYRTDVFLRSVEDLRETVTGDPFAAIADARQAASHVMFLSTSRKRNDGWQLTVHQQTPRRAAVVLVTRARADP